MYLSVLQNPLTYIVNLICNNIYVIQDNGTVSASAIEIIPNIHPVSLFFSPAIPLICNNFILANTGTCRIQISK